MVICQQKVVNYTTKHRLLNKEATHLTPVDLEKAKLGNPLMPATPYKVATIIDCQILTLITSFTIYCPLAQHLRNISSALKQTAGRYNNMPDYKWKYTAEILWQVTHCTTKFFSFAATPQQLAHLPIGSTIPFLSLFQLTDNI